MTPTPEKKPIDDWLAIVNLVVACMILMVLFSIVALFGIYGEVQGLSADALEDTPLHAFLITTIPMLLALVVIPTIWEVGRRKKDREYLLLATPRTAWGWWLLALGFCVGAGLGVTFWLNTGAWFLVIHFAVVAFSEEFFFRGVVQQRLTSVVGTWGAVLGTAFLFAFLLHASQPFLDNLVYRFPIGMLLGILTLFTRSLWPAIFLHFAYNVMFLV